MLSKAELIASKGDLPLILSSFVRVFYKSGGEGIQTPVDQRVTRAGMCLDSCARFRSEVNPLRYQRDFRAQITSSLVQISTTKTRNGLRNRTLRRAFSRSGCTATGTIRVQQFWWYAGLSVCPQASKERVIASFQKHRGRCVHGVSLRFVLLAKDSPTLSFKFHQIRMLALAFRIMVLVQNCFQVCRLRIGNHCASL